jgi:hypothetical protein
VETLNVSTFGDKLYQKQPCQLIKLELFKKDGDASRISALTFPKICSALPSRVDLSNCPVLASLDLASDVCHDDRPIDILIGSDLYWDFVSGRVVHSEAGLVAIESKFGWIISGVKNGPDVDAGCESTNSVTNLIITREVGAEELVDYLTSDLKRFWETE